MQPAFPYLVWSTTIGPDKSRDATGRGSSARAAGSNARVEQEATATLEGPHGKV